MTPAQLQTASNLLQGNITAPALADADLLTIGCAMGRAPHIARQIEEELARRRGVGAQTEMDLTRLPPPPATKPPEPRASHKQCIAIMPDTWITTRDVAGLMEIRLNNAYKMLSRMAENGMVVKSTGRNASGHSVAIWRKPHVKAAKPSRWPQYHAALTGDWQSTQEIADKAGVRRDSALRTMRKMQNAGEVVSQKEVSQGHLVNLWRLPPV